MTRSKLITNLGTVAYGDASTSSSSSDQQLSNASRKMTDEKPTQPLQSDKVSVKLVKTSPAQEATTERKPSSSSSKSSQLPHQANHSPIATFGNIPITLHLGVNQKFTWIFMVAGVKYNIIGANFLSSFSINVNFEKNCFEFGNISIPLVF